MAWHVWADDTSNNPLIDGSVVAFLNGGARNFTQGQCAIGAVGCESDEFGILQAWLDPGDHVLAIEVHQRGGGPTGILVQEVNAVPLPGGLVMLGSVMLGLGIFRTLRK